jgi:hypothetical protein
MRLPRFVSPSSDTGAFSHIFFSFIATGDSSDEATATESRRHILEMLLTETLLVYSSKHSRKFKEVGSCIGVIQGPCTTLKDVVGEII